MYNKTGDVTQAVVKPLEWGADHPATSLQYKRAEWTELEIGIIGQWCDMSNVSKIFYLLLTHLCVKSYIFLYL